MNKFCFGAIYNGRLWEKELRVSAHEDLCVSTVNVFSCKVKIECLVEPKCIINGSLLGL